MYLTRLKIDPHISINNDLFVHSVLITSSLILKQCDFKAKKTCPRLKYHGLPLQPHPPELLEMVALPKQTLSSAKKVLKKAVKIPCRQTSTCGYGKRPFT